MEEWNSVRPLKEIDEEFPPDDQLPILCVMH